MHHRADAYPPLVSKHYLGHVVSTSSGPHCLVVIFSPRPRVFTADVGFGPGHFPFWSTVPGPLRHLSNPSPSPLFFSLFLSLLSFLALLVSSHTLHTQVLIHYGLCLKGGENVKPRTACFTEPSYIINTLILTPPRTLLAQQRTSTNLF